MLSDAHRDELLAMVRRIKEIDSALNATVSIDDRGVRVQLHGCGIEAVPADARTHETDRYIHHTWDRDVITYVVLTRRSTP